MQALHTTPVIRPHRSPPARCFRTTPLQMKDLAMSKPALHLVEPPLSDARQALAELNAELADLSRRNAELQPKIARANEARASVPSAEAALSRFLFEVDLGDRERDSAEHQALRQAVRDARRDAIDTTALEAENDSLQAEYASKAAKRPSLIAVVVKEAADDLEREYHDAARRALRMQAAIVGLERWAASEGLVRMAVDLASSTRPARDLGESVRVQDRLKAEGETITETWRAYPASLAADPTAQPPEVI